MTLGCVQLLYFVSVFTIFRPVSPTMKAEVIDVDQLSEAYEDFVSVRSQTTCLYSM